MLPTQIDPRSFYEAGSCQVEFGCDCFTLLFEFATLAHYGAEVCGSHSTVRRALILNHEFCSQGLGRVSRHLNQFSELTFSHLNPELASMSASLNVTLVRTFAITLHHSRQAGRRSKTSLKLMRPTLTLVSTTYGLVFSQI